MSSIGRVPNVRSARRAGAALVVVAFAAMATGAPLGATTAAKASGPKITFSGPAVTGKAKGINQFCVESTGPDGLQLGVSLTTFRVGKQTFSLSMVFRGPVYAPGEHQFSAPKQGATGAIVTFVGDKNAGSWTSGDGNGSATLSPDKTSGKFEGDLVAGSGVALKTGPGVHVKGKFKCTQVDKQ